MSHAFYLYLFFFGEGWFGGIKKSYAFVCYPRILLLKMITELVIGVLENLLFAWFHLNPSSVVIPNMGILPMDLMFKLNLLVLIWNFYDLVYYHIVILYFDLFQIQRRPYVLSQDYLQSKLFSILQVSCFNHVFVYKIQCTCVFLTLVFHPCSLLVAKFLKFDCCIS